MSKSDPESTNPQPVEDLSVVTRRLSARPFAITAVLLAAGIIGYNLHPDTDTNRGQSHEVTSDANNVWAGVIGNSNGDNSASIPEGPSPGDTQADPLRLVGDDDQGGKLLAGPTYHVGPDGKRYIELKYGPDQSSSLKTKHYAVKATCERATGRLLIEEYRDPFADNPTSLHYEDAVHTRVCNPGHAIEAKAGNELVAFLGLQSAYSEWADMSPGN